MKHNKTNILSLSTVILFTFGCNNPAGTRDAYVSQAADVADLAAELADNSAKALTKAGPDVDISGQRVHEGDSGTATVSWTLQANEDGRTRTRTIKFENFTKEGRRLSNINGEITYTFTFDRPDGGGGAGISRTLKGSLTATATNDDGTTEEVSLELDFTFEREPGTHCVVLTGSVTANGQGFVLNRERDQKRCAQ